MGRIGNFFKKAWNGVKKGVKWVVNKGVDIGKKIIDNPIVRTAASAVGSAFGVPPPATQAANVPNAAITFSLAIKPVAAATANTHT